MKTKNSNKNWHSIPPQQLLHAFQTSEHGLSAQEAKTRLKKYGENILKPKKQSWLKKITEPFRSLFVLVLLGAIVISLITGKNLDAVIIAIIVSVNAIIFYFQQYSVSKVLNALKKQEDGVITVERNGQPVEIPATQIVPGDIVYIFEGNKIPADGRILESSNLQINESMLTGEALPITKQADTLPQKLKIYDQTNMVFRGTVAHAGGGRFIVTGTGNNTEIGNITKLVGKSDLGRTPIERKIDAITKAIIIGVGIIGTVVFALAIVRGIELSEALRFSLSLVVSVVPEGLPVTLTIVLLLSAKKMAKHKALVKKLSSIETMGAVTLIATDKTGTITQNNLQVATDRDFTGHLHRTASGSITLQNGVVMDPLDEILQKEYTHPAERRHIRSFPFDQKLRVSGALIKEGSQYKIYIKGAPEAFLKYLKPNKAYKTESILEEYTKKGYRTIAFAHTIGTQSIQQITPGILKKAALDGLVGLADPLRPRIAQAIADARTAGIRVVMLTGDHVNTAAEIAKQAKLATSGEQVATSQLIEIPRPWPAMKIILYRISVFGRVLPEHKFNFLKSVKGHEITAMTGDGVNDIPALVEADAGLSMGSGTDAAKDASDIILLDDDFSTIIEAVRLGRATIANIRKMLYYLISTSVGEAGTMIGALLMGLPLPVTAIQILWINIVTDGFTVLPLGLSGPEKHQMKQPPYDPKASLLSKVLTSRMLVAGISMSVATLVIFYTLLPKGLAYAQTAAFLALVVVQWANALNANFEKGSWLSIFKRPNFKLTIGILVSILFQLVAFVGPLKEPFGIVSLELNDILLATLLPTTAIFLVVDIHKALVKIFKVTS